MGVPAILIVTLLVAAAGAFAWYTFGTEKSTTTVKEPLKTANEVEFNAEMYPKDSNTWSFDIVNSAGNSYDVQVTLSKFVDSNGNTGLNAAKDGKSVDITSFVVNSTDKTSDLLDDGVATSTVPADGSISLSLEVTATGDAEPGDVLVELSLARA